jgi:hypothetical protein
MKNSLCNLCNLVEDYSHYFRTCIFFKDFWGKIKELLKKSGIENDITLYHQFLQILTTLFLEFSVLIISTHSFGIAFFMMVNSVIQLDSATSYGCRENT